MRKTNLLLIMALLLIGLAGCALPGGPEVPGIDKLELLVLDSLNGSPLEGVDITLVKKGETVAAYTGKTDAEGFLVIDVEDFDPSQEFDILAAKDDKASCRIQDFTFDSGVLPVLYCHDLMMINYAAEAPEITKIEYSSDEVLWNEFNGDIQMADFRYVRVSAQGKSEIKETGWCGYGIKISINGIITHWDGLAASSFEKEGEQIGTTGYYETIAIFDLSTHDYMAGDYSLFIHAYDVAANRVEQTVNLSLSAPSAAADPSLADVTPVISNFSAKTYSVSRDYFGSPIDLAAAGSTLLGSDYLNGEGTTYYISLDIDIAEEIRRIDILRSENGGQTYKILDKNLTFSNPSSAGSYTFADFDATIKIGTTYHYKVIAYNGSGASKESAAINLELLPPHNTLLTAPANKYVSDSLTPNFTFSVTNIALMDENTADILNFQLQIRDTLKPLYSFPMEWDRVNNTVSIFGNDYDESIFLTEDIASGIITINFASFGAALEAGKSYEWNIIGDGHGTYFAKNYYNADGTVLLGQVQSLASNGASGQGSLNGWFSLSISDTAQ